MMTNSTTKVYDEALQERVRKYMKDTGLFVSLLVMV